MEECVHPVAVCVSQLRPLSHLILLAGVVLKDKEKKERIKIFPRNQRQTNKLVTAFTLETFIEQSIFIKSVLHGPVHLYAPMKLSKQNLNIKTT